MFINPETGTLNKGTVRIIILAVALFIVTLVGVSVYDFETIKGSELGVRETMNGGVEQTPLGPQMYLRNRITTTIYHYDMTSRVFVMNDVTGPAEKGHGRENDPYLVQSQDQQDMHISLNVRWRIDPAKVIQIHQRYHAHVKNHDEDLIEERLIRPTAMLIVKNHATRMKAIEAYSGEGLVKLQTEIETALADPKGDLFERGIIVENFVIEKIALDPNYVAEIKARQIAGQKQLRAVEEQKAAEAEALKAKAEAQADLNRAVVQAERDKQVAILKAEQEKQMVVLTAQGEGQRLTVIAEAERTAAIAKAQAIEALGRANAEAQRLQYAAYAAPGAEVFAQIEVAKQMAAAFQGIQGYLPQGMTINLLSENFLASVRGMMQPRAPLTPTTTK